MEETAVQVEGILGRSNHRVGKLQLRKGQYCTATSPIQTMCEELLYLQTVDHLVAASKLLVHHLECTPIHKFGWVDNWFLWTN